MTGGNYTGTGRAAGFTVVELLVAALILMALALLTMPALDKLIVRSSLDGFARQAATTLQQARQESIRRSLPVVVGIDMADRELFSFVDADGDRAFDGPGSTDLSLATITAPNQVSFGGPPGDVPPVTGFTANLAVFRPDGSVASQGAVRVRDTRGNFLEVRVAPAATARIVLRKWEPHSSGTGGTWYIAGEGGRPWRWKV